MFQEIISAIFKVLKLIFAFVLTPVIIAFGVGAFILVIPIYVFRFIIKLYAKYYRPDLGNIMTTRSAVFVTDDLYRKPKANIVMVSSVNVKFVMEEFMENLSKTSLFSTKANGELVFPEMQQHISSFAGFPFWKWDKSFRVEDHVREFDKSTTLTQSLVDELCTKLIKTPFVPGQSPWEMIVFPKCNLNPNETLPDDESRAAIIVRLHHSLADGFSILKFTSSTILPDEDGKMKTITPEKQRLKMWQKILYFLCFLARAPYEFVSSFLEAFDTNECHVAEAKLSENVMLAFSGKIPIDYIKDIKQSHGVSFTAVLLAAFTGALRSFMLENKYTVPEAIHSVTPFPMPGHSDKLRNYMTTCFIRLPIKLSTAEERLLAIEAHLNSLKKSTQPITTFYLLMLMGALPTFLARVLFKQYGPTALISNFPGPQEKISLLGMPLEDIMFTAGLLPGRIGIGFDALSYDGNVRIQAAFNEALMLGNTQPTGKFMLDKVLLELQHLSDKHVL